jgi:ketosteroid isomerase-like protein
VRGLYQAAMSDALPALLALLDDDVVVNEPAFLPYGGIYRGKDGFGKLLEKIAKTYDMTAIKFDDLMADGNQVFGILRMPDLRTGGDVLLAERSTIRDGRIVDMTIFFHDAQSLIDAPKL